VRAVPIDHNVLRAWIFAYPEITEQLLRVLAVSDAPTVWPI
jgi:hypothetical protein